MEEKIRLSKQEALREKEERARYWMEETAMEWAYTHVRNKQFLLS
jgi:hypothetical protein